MCGFGGVVNSSFWINGSSVAKVAKSVSHRGPDSSGFALFNELFEPQDQGGSHVFFFNRLAIIDLDPRSNQPFQDERFLLLFNGEIYNYKEIKAELVKKGIVFKTLSDTEVLFYALQIWGKDALDRLNGMFAFFWIDKKERSFILARDRIGIKPLYYKIENHALIFASELDSVIRFSKAPSPVSLSSVNSYLCLQYVPTPNTIIENVHKLAPGNFIEGTVQDLKGNRTLNPRCYWDAYNQVRPENSGHGDDDLENILVESLQGQLEADVPLGLFLSSGVDSSLLTAIINKHFSGRPYDFFTIAFDQDTVSDESTQAIRYLKEFKNPQLRHHSLTVNPKFILSKINSLYNIVDEPFADPAVLLNWAISEKAREHVTVALSGDGADEMFWGYERYNEWRSQSQRIYKKIPGLSSIEQILISLPETRLKYTLINMLEADPVSIYFKMLRPRLFGFLPGVETKSDLWCLQGLDKLKHRADLPSLIDLKAYLADAMLYKVDRASMAASLEVRVPYLDNKVIDYALKLTLDRKSTSNFQNKAPLKALLAKLAPHYDVHMKKRGFNFPLTKWLRHEWKEMVLDTLTAKSLDEVGLQPYPFMNIVDQFYNKRVNCTNEIWYLFNLVLWHNKFKLMLSRKNNE